MAQRGIREYEGKKILFDGMARHIPAFKGRSGKLALVKPGTKPKDLLKANPWLGNSTSVIEKQLRIFSPRRAASARPPSAPPSRICGGSRCSRRPGRGLAPISTEMPTEKPFVSCPADYPGAFQRLDRRRRIEPRVVVISGLLKRKAAAKKAPPPPAMQRIRWMSLALKGPVVFQG